MLTEKTKKTGAAKSKPIFYKIIRPLSLLILLNALILLLVLKMVGVLTQLNQNSYDIFRKQVDNRQGYLQSQMTERWMKLGDLADYINNRAYAMVRSGAMNLEELDSKPSACSPLILEVVDQLISEMYTKQVSGIFITFNTHDLRADIDGGNWQNKTGIYIRDNDPLSASSEKYADLLLECAPVPVVQALHLSTDSGWEQRFKFDSDHPYEDWLTAPYLTAAAAEGTLEAEDCGLWSLRHDAAGKTALCYTIPLVLRTGEVYGVLGVEMLPAYLNSQLPNEELDEDGVYALLMSTEEQSVDSFRGTVYAVNDRTKHFALNDTVELSPSRYGGWETSREGETYAVAQTQLQVYSRNGPFESQRWYVMGAVPTRDLYSFSDYVRVILILTTLLMLAIGLTGALVIGWRIARPVAELRRELGEAQDGEIPQLSKTGISEVDDFASAITGLSRDVVNSSRRFLSIMKMSSIDMGGYELDEKTGFLFVTDNFFSLFGQRDVPVRDMTMSEFRERMDRLSAEMTTEKADNGVIYAVPGPEGSTHYTHVQETRVESRCIGVAEDVTIQVLERKRIEHERDYDILTGIYNRRAFYRDAEQILSDPEKLRTAAVLMIDLDNLKILNDTYGHEWGDRYIVAGARCIRDHVPEKSVIGRVSGDEFNLLLYGFRNREEARSAVEALQRSFHESCFVLPDGKVRPIGASGGVVYVEEEMGTLKELIKYADFAMYLVKHGKKGFFGEFDPSVYHASEVEQLKHRAFKRVLREEKIQYFFQPIVDARTGELHAVEALMRVMDAEIANTGEFLRIARQENMLDEIEHITWFHALSAFRRLLEVGTMDRKTRVFVNSQVSQLLNASEQQNLIDRYGDIRENTVMEVVETDDYSVELSGIRERAGELFAKDFALDDFGTGYNNEKNLLELMPRYVKLDMALVRDVEKHPDRQKLISGLIAFAHERGMIVLAEGVETMAELKCLLDLDVDMLQGYLLARPAPIPASINPEAAAVIRFYNSAKNQ